MFQGRGVEVPRAKLAEAARSTGKCADFAGDVISRSMSGFVVSFGMHCINTPSSMQAPFRLSSNESAFYPCAKGGAALLGLRSMIDKWGLDVGRALRLLIRCQGFASSSRADVDLGVSDVSSIWFLVASGQDFSWAGNSRRDDQQNRKNVVPSGKG